MSSPVAGWYVDPQDPAAWRWWDGARWTAQTSPGAQARPGAPWTEPLLYVRHHDGFADMQTAVTDPSGAPLAWATAAGIQGGLTGWSMTIVDAAGAPLLVVREPNRLMKQAIYVPWIVEDGSGRELGRFAARRVSPRRHFSFDFGGPDNVLIGQTRMENYPALVSVVTDAAGNEVARTQRVAPPQQSLTERTDAYSIAFSLPQPEALHRVALAFLIARREIQRKVGNVHLLGKSLFDPG